MGVRRLRLAGFETELLGIIAAGFRFSDPSLRDLALVVDRNLFASDLPDADDIAVTASADDNGMPFDPLKEPAIAIYREPGRGIESTSSSASRMGFNLRVVLRVPKSLQSAVQMLDELVVWFELNVVGKTTEHFKVSAYETLGMPVPYRRLADDKSAASATVRFQAVALS
jgi:hypothetical protein